MPHVPILELRPELREQDEALNDPDDPQTGQDATDLNDQSTSEASAGETDTNTTVHNLEAKCTGAKYGVMQRVKKFIFRSRVVVKNNTRRIRPNDDPDDPGTQLLLMMTMVKAMMKQMLEILRPIPPVMI